MQRSIVGKMEEAGRQKPFDSKIEIGSGDRGEDVVTIPPAGISLSRLGPALFIFFWLCGWAVGVCFAAWSARSPSTTLGARIFVIAWLGGWLVGGAFAWASLASMVTAMFGEERIAFDYDEVVHTRSALGIKRVARYPIQRVQKFECRPGYGRAGGRALTTAACTMLFGKRRLPIAHGVTDVEAEWLVKELNSLLERRRR